MLRVARNWVVLVAMGLAIAGCASHTKQTASRDPFAGKGSPIYPGKGPVPWGGGKYYVGKPYQVAGRWFEPQEQPNYDKKGTASWYGEDFNRRKTSNGEWFDMNRLTAAHATLPLPSYVKVTNLENGRELVVRVNDRGPFVNTRVIDLSKAAADALDYRNKGTTTVRVQYLGPAPLDDNGSHLMAMNKALSNGTADRNLIATADRMKGRAPAANTMVAAAQPAPQKKAKQALAQVETVAYTPPPAAAPAAQQPTQQAAGDVTYYIQLGSFADGANAARARDQFSSAWPVQFIELSGAAGPIYRVRLGPIAEEGDAATALTDAQSAGYTDARLIKTAAVQASLQ